jgi:myxalamid-type polyketide synthase MxaE and MxaD
VAAADGPSKYDVVYLAGAQDSSAYPESEPYTAALRECGAVQELVQAMTNRRGSLPRLWIITQGCQPTGCEEQPLALEQAPLWGLGRNLMTANPDLRCVLVDLDPDETADAQVGLLIEELTRPDCETDVAFRRGSRFVARLTHAEAEPLNGTRLSLRAEAVYLVTEGLSGPGLSVAQWLADKGARHLLLTSKTPPSAEAEKALAKLRERGITVHVEMIDVARREDLARVLDACGRTLPPLRGVVHAAGILDDSAWQDLGRRRLAGMVAPKTAGAWHLHELTRDQPLEFFILFSSASVLLGSEGQASYAAANAFLDGLAWYRKAMGLPALTINWGPWDTSAAVAGARRRHLEPLGVDVTPSTEALLEMETLLIHEQTRAAVVTFNWLRVAGDAAQRLRLLADLATHDPTTLTQEMISAVRQELAALEGGERKIRLQHYIDQQLSRVAGMKPGELDPQQPLNSLGLDSLMVLDLLTDLQEKLQVPIPAEQLLAGANLDQLSTELARSLDAPPMVVESGSS